MAAGCVHGVHGVSILIAGRVLSIAASLSGRKSATTTIISSHSSGASSTTSTHSSTHGSTSATTTITVTTTINHSNSTTSSTKYLLDSTTTTIKLANFITCKTIILIKCIPFFAYIALSFGVVDVTTADCDGGGYAFVAY